MLRNNALIGIISYALLVIGIYLADKISFILFTKIILGRPEGTEGRRGRT